MQRELARIGKSIERLINAYQEELVSLEQLRERMPSLHQRQQASRAELLSIADQANDRAAFLRLAETLTAFLARLRSAADTLDVTERQRIVRLVVKEVLVGDDNIVIRHCIPATSTPPPDNGPPAPTGLNGRPEDQSYLCVWGVVSPLLANVYLHYVFDLWVRRWRQVQARGDVVVVRFADDFVVGFEHREEAERFLAELRDRFAQFGLALHPDKTRLLEFSRFAVPDRRARGDGKPETFNFLGFTHACSRTRTGRFTVLRQTMRRRWQAKLHEVKTELRRRLHAPIPTKAPTCARSSSGTRATTACPATGRALPPSTPPSCGSGALR